MTKQKTGMGSRRGFLARLAAVGTALGGVVPELRAYGMTGSMPSGYGSMPGMGGSTSMPSSPTMTPTTPTGNTQLPPLPPATVAMMYSSALIDPDVRALVGQTRPGSRIMPVQKSSDLGGNGQFIVLPIRTSIGVTNEFILFGHAKGTTTSGQTIVLPIRLMLRSDGSAMAAYQGQVATPPPETQNTVRNLYAAFFPNEFLSQRISAAANARQSGQGQAPPAQGHAAASPPRATRAQCESAYRARVRELEPWASYRDSTMTIFLISWAVAVICIMTMSPILLIAAGVLGSSAIATIDTGSQVSDALDEALDERRRCMRLAID
jgi:hypothetical protein